MKVVLFGMKHSGKSALGRKLAREWNCPFFDLDEILVKDFEEESGVKTPVRQIFAQTGEEAFSDREKKAVFDLYKRLSSTDSPYVIAAGGRIPIASEPAQILKKMGVNVFLKVDPETSWERIQRTGLPSFLTSPHPREEFLALCKKKEPLYERQADLSLDLGDLNLERSYKKLKLALKDVS
jgi:shikimate kinase